MKSAGTTGVAHGPTSPCQEFYNRIFGWPAAILDHLSVAVASRAAVAILSFQDPDDIDVELCAPEGRPRSGWGWACRVPGSRV
ncbi:hypothetical protein Mycch_0055 [Mycolicibacterium chubuense NBB4]|uniref:Uncharacterized protein n=1 Tax=Mycolicibacterium chubuense (strain NBB4) TaxID=710421 RepID=I4BC76_MYCCN|nr:hypothetical protein Mycch_0055 [Mycolicibacterium chubuense NBB4]